MDSSSAAASRHSSETPTAIPQVSIIVPARNEEASLGECLQSLISQAGVTFEIIVVDDGSTDRTREIAQSFSTVQVISAEPLHGDLSGKNWTGKSNALVCGGKAARAEWLLFTDADTVHRPGSLARAVAEAKHEHADLLSYSPEQVVVTFAERTVMPVIFAELAAQYPPHKVRAQNSEVVAANGQYILVRRDAYEAVGGHAAIADEILEDVALARLFRNARYRVYFRYGGDSVRTRMYRSWPQVREGWTKNLALLFPHAGRLALRSILVWFAAWLALGIVAFGLSAHHFLWILAAAVWLVVYRRIQVAHFAVGNNLLAIAIGLPIFSYLLLRSKNAHANGRVFWKGRTYELRAPAIMPARAQSSETPLRLGKAEKRELRTEN